VTRQFIVIEARWVYELRPAEGHVLDERAVATFATRAGAETFVEGRKRSMTEWERRKTIFEIQEAKE
jgi:hypothetical protein